MGLISNLFGKKKKTGLKTDIFNAFLNSTGLKEPQPKLEKLSLDLSRAIIKFLKAQTFHITEMKAVLEVEKLDTAGPLQADVLPSVTTSVNGGMTGNPGPVVGATGVVSTGTKGVLIPPIILRKRPEPGVVHQGGVMIARGHAYVGRNPITRRKGINKTKVRLLKIRSGSDK
tara:strand:+ start:372 stop:887 length:516 start_codon:yes stop_codon:yes gene_type:complete